MKPSILIVVPTYRHFEYAAEAIASAFKNTTAADPHVIMVDDASPQYPHHTKNDVFLSHLPVQDRDVARDKFDIKTFDRNGGLTRSWNYGLDYAKRYKHDYCCVTNSDVYFPPNWDQQIVEGLKKHALVGPVTNAPGTSKEQYVRRYSMLYEVPQSFRPKPEDETYFGAQAVWKSALHDEVGKVQYELSQVQSGRFKPTTLNGFCMVAKTATWFENAFDAEHVFRPRNDFNSKGEPNPTPLMTLNEYELQARWRAKGLTSAVCLGSYVFHYRAVSRGDTEKRGDWVRNEGAA